MNPTTHIATTHSAFTLCGTTVAHTEYLHRLDEDGTITIPGDRGASPVYCTACRDRWLDAANLTPDNPWPAIRDQAIQGLAARMETLREPTGEEKERARQRSENADAGVRAWGGTRTTFHSDGTATTEEMPPLDTSLHATALRALDDLAHVADQDERRGRLLSRIVRHINPALTRLSELQEENALLRRNLAAQALRPARWPATESNWSGIRAYGDPPAVIRPITDTSRLRNRIDDIMRSGALHIPQAQYGHTITNNTVQSGDEEK